MPVASDDANAYSNWTKEQLEFFTAKFNAGLAYSLIAANMNAKFGTSLSNNSVASICFRKGYKRLKDGRTGNKVMPNIRRSRKATTISPATMLKMKAQQAALGIVSDDKAGMKLLKLPIWSAASHPTVPLINIANNCRWPFTCDDGSTVFCKNDQERGPYCLAHASIAYRERSKT